MWASNNQFTKVCVDCRRKLGHPEKPTSLWGEGANSTEKVHNGNLKDRALLGGYNVIRAGRGASEPLAAPPTENKWNQLATPV